jgi:hypothetical protein
MDNTAAGRSEWLRTGAIPILHSSRLARGRDIIIIIIIIIIIMIIIIIIIIIINIIIITCLLKVGAPLLHSNAVHQLVERHARAIARSLQILVEFRSHHVQQPEHEQRSYEQRRP